MEEFPNASGAEVLPSRQGAVPRANAPRHPCAPMGPAAVTMFSTHGCTGELPRGCLRIRWTQQQETLFERNWS